MDSKITGPLFAVAFACTLFACASGDAPKSETAAVGEATRVEHVIATSQARDMTAPAGPLEGKVQLAAALAREISAAPEQTNKILRRHGLDRDKLDTMMFEIAGDPELTRAYLIARRTR